MNIERRGRRFISNMAIVGAIALVLYAVGALPRPDCNLNCRCALDRLLETPRS